MSMTMAEKSGLEVLVADDSAPVRTRLMEMLSAIEGLKVVGEARNASEALASIRALQPDVVILDIRMPGGSGIDVLRNVKRDFPEIVIVMLTNHAEPQYRQKCAELKADYFLSKSTDWSVLIEIGERLVRGGKAHG